jgi:SdrD B-like protein
MSQEVGQNELQAKTRQLMDGPLKHIKAAVLAAALVPLASVLATPASAQTACASGGTICGTVFIDTNGDGTQQLGEPGLEGQEVQILCKGCPTSDMITLYTDSSGHYFSGQLDTSLTYSVAVLIPTGDSVSPTAPPDGNIGGSNGGGFSVATGVHPNGLNDNFGFVTSSAANPGTGTPGYWKNHPEAWPVATITVGGVTYNKTQAISWLGMVGKDKTTTMFSSLVPAILNVKIGNDGTCVNAAIAAAQIWMTAPLTGYGPVGSKVAASSYAWSVGEPIHQVMDAYNNGLLCAPHRQ